MDDTKQSTPPPVHRTRGTDRRCNKTFSLPPFYSREGKILAERRSPIDRRANWIREFPLDAADNGPTKKES